MADYPKEAADAYYDRQQQSDKKRDGAGLISRLRDKDQMVIGGLLYCGPVMRDAADWIEFLERQNLELQHDLDRSMSNHNADLNATVRPECGTRNAAGAAAAGSENVAPSGVLPVDVAPAAPAEGPTPRTDRWEREYDFDVHGYFDAYHDLMSHARHLERESDQFRRNYDAALIQLGAVSTAPLFVPNEAMLNAARDWSHEKFGKPIGNDAATGCWQAMYTALYRATPVSATQERT